MRKRLSRLPKKVLAASAAVVVVVGLTTVATKAWFPDRPTFTMQNPAPYVTFDSITDNPNYGDERTFFDAKDAANTGTGGFADAVNVTSGETVMLRMYVHNDAASNLNGANFDGTGVAHNASARIFLPTAFDNALRANAYIDASNANPGEVADTVDFKGSSPFKLQYVPGSATMYTNAAPSGFALNDSIVTTGAPIGYTGANGTIPGCLQYSGIITIKVKVMAPGFTLEKMVANKGDKTWNKSITAQPGATVSYQLAFTNTGSEPLQNVVLRDKLPDGVTMVANSSTLFNGSHPSGVNLGTDSVTTTNGVNVGTYNPTSNAFLQFKATVPTEDKLKCGENVFVNTAEAWVGNDWTSSKATVTVNKTCQNTPTYACTLLDVTKGDNRTVTVSKFDQTAKDGAAFKNVVIDWGDSSTPLTTTTAVGKTHQYGADGTYTIKAVAHFDVNGQDKTSDSQSCMKQVSFTSTPPSTPPTSPPTLVNTGPGEVVGLFGVVTIAGAIAHNLLSRRTVRE